MRIILLLLLLLFNGALSYAGVPANALRQMAIEEALTATEMSMSGQQIRPQDIVPAISTPQKTSPERKHKYDLGFQVQSFDLETDDKWPYYYSTGHTSSDKVEKSGTLYGIHAAATWSLYEPVNSWKDLLDHNELPNFIKLEAEGNLGKTDYTSAVTGTRSDYKAWDIDAHLLLGYDIAITNSTLLTPYLGLGFYRSEDETGGWVDYFVNDYAEFTNRKNYIYIPVGVETLTTINEQWDINLKLEGDIIFGGAVDYLLNEIPGSFAGVDVTTAAVLDLVPQKATADLKGGFGIKTSVKLIRKLKQCDLYIEPFFKFLYLNKSEEVQAKSIDLISGKDYVSVYPDASPYKPLWDEKNYTTVFGLRSGVQF